MFNCYAREIIAPAGFNAEHEFTGAWREAPEKPIKGINYISSIRRVTNGEWVASVMEFVYYSKTLPAGAVDREYKRLLEQEEYSMLSTREVKDLAKRLIADRTPWATKSYTAILTETDGRYHLFILGAPDKVAQEFASVIIRNIDAESTRLSPVLNAVAALAMRDTDRTYGFTTGDKVSFANEFGDKLHWCDYSAREPNDVLRVIREDGIRVTGVSAVSPTGFTIWLTDSTVFGVMDLADHTEGVTTVGNKFFTGNADGVITIWVEALLALSDDLFPYMEADDE